MTLVLYIGPMCGGKTTSLLSTLDFHSRVVNVLYINHTLDSRNDELFSTHGNTTLDPGKSTIKDSKSLRPLSSVGGSTLMKIDRLSSIPDEMILRYQVILIDEGQFFPDLKSRTIHFVDVLKREVYVGSLDGDYTRNPFGQILELVPHCDEVIKLKPLCVECGAKGIREPAIFTKRINDTTGQQIEVGSENYRPVCRGCYLSLSPTSDKMYLSLPPTSDEMPDYD